MKYTSTAPTRPPVTELVEHGAPLTRSGPQQTGETVLAYLQLLWGHRRQLLRLTLFAVLAGTALAFLIPARYSSTTRLMPPDNQGSSGLAMAAAAMSNAAGGLGGMASDLLGLKSTSDIFVGVLTSRTVQDKLIQQFDLQKLYRASRMEDARRELEERTAISVDRKSQIIAVTVTDKSPQRAASMARAYVDELNRLVADLSTSSARRERIFLEGRLDAVNQDLESAEKEFSQFASKNKTIDVKEQGRAMVEAAATLQGRMIAAQSELEGLRQIYSDNNVRVRATKARIDELQLQLGKLGGKGEGNSLSADQPDDAMYPSIKKLPLLGVEFADLYRRTKIQEAVLETLTKQYELAKVQEAKEIPTVKVLDVADVPGKKSFPPRLFIIFLVTGLVLLAGMLWVFARALWNGTDSSDPGKIFAQEIFATLSARVPRFAPNGSIAHSDNGDAPRWAALPVKGKRFDADS